MNLIGVLLWESAVGVTLVKFPLSLSSLLQFAVSCHGRFGRSHHVHSRQGTVRLRFVHSAPWNQESTEVAAVIIAEYLPITCTSPQNLQPGFRQTAALKSRLPFRRKSHDLSHQHHLLLAPPHLIRTQSTASIPTHQTSITKLCTLPTLLILTFLIQ